MQILPLNELLDSLQKPLPVAIVFPFSSPRAAGPGNPTSLSSRDGHDLFVLALLRLVTKFGEPDAPNAQFAHVPALSTRNDFSCAIWDFDYYSFVLRLERSATDEGAFSVVLDRLVPTKADQ